MIRRLLPRGEQPATANSAVISLISFVGASAVGGAAGPVFLAALGSFAIGWIVLGLQAVRIDRPAIAAGTA